MEVVEVIVASAESTLGAVEHVVGRERFPAVQEGPPVHVIAVVVLDER